VLEHSSEGRSGTSLKPREPSDLKQKKQKNKTKKKPSLKC
jgi:hypothetical protein